MKVGRARRAWVKNCVGLGLSAGFVEPLEATAIFSIELAARWLVGFLPDRQISPAFSDRFNKLVAGLFDEVRDFIMFHYVTANRTEPFWQAARSEVALSDTLRENLDLWQHVPPDMTDTPGHHLFGYWNYLYCLWPKGIYDGKTFPLEGSIVRGPWDRYGAELNRQREELLANLPSHYELLCHIRGETPAPQVDPIFDIPEDLKRKLSTQSTVPLP